MTTPLPPAPRRDQSFSSELKLFVGNLPFNVDSAQVAQLFESAGNVEMIEVWLKLSYGFSRNEITIESFVLLVFEILLIMGGVDLWQNDSLYVSKLR